MKSRMSERCQLEISESPKIGDARELKTILISSVRALFGELESFSYGLKVRKTDVGGQQSFIVECSRESVPAIRSALSMVTPPPYLAGKIYRFDVVGVKLMGKNTKVEERE